VVTPVPTPTPSSGYIDVSRDFPANAAPYGIYATQQDVWFTDRANDAIGRISISTAAFDEISVSAGVPQEVTTDNNGSVIFSEDAPPNTAAVGKYTPSSGTMTSVALHTAAGLGASGIAADAAGDAYVAIGSTDASAVGQGIFSYNFATGAVSGSPLGSPFSTPFQYDPTSIAIDHFGHIWVSDTDANTVEVLDTAGNVLYQLYSDGLMPASLAEGPDHNMYVTEPNARLVQAIDETTFAQKISFPTACSAGYLAAGAKQDLWLTEPACNRVARINLAGPYIQQYPSTVAGGAPDHITVDAADNVWFTDSNLHKVFKFVP
jgi:streptogramin lyase